MIIKYKKSGTTLNVYQARNGSIQLLLGTINWTLTLPQVLTIESELYNIEDFDIVSYNNYYNITK